MDQETARRLVDLNLQFYQTFARHFSATRQRLQPGVRRVLAGVTPEQSILDLGCGNGELGRELARSGRRGGYVGVDFSAQLLQHTRRRIPKGFAAQWVAADLTQPGWENALPPGVQYDLVFAFALLHHLPGDDLRRQLCCTVHGLLAPQGRFALSCWQFAHSRRLWGRRQPWEAAGLRSQDVDPGDYLLDWRHGGLGLRYVHLFTPEELDTLASDAGFGVQESFYSDGEGGRLGLYQSWLPI